MGGSKKETSTQSSTTTPQRTAEEIRLQQIQLGQAEAADPMIRQLQQEGGEAMSALLRGQPLPGNLAALSRGITPEVTGELVQESLRDIRPGLQEAGLMDSGVRAALEARTAGDIRRNVAESNLSRLMNLLNIGVGGQAQVQQPMLTTTGQLGQALAGARTIRSTGQTTTPQKPWWQGAVTGFSTGLGQGLGQGMFPV